ncbi:hypothetical protein [Rugosimonospora africana]|uniref:hypothetical protein n=1 Tax=Rugosimonospora africana TaxID=556532 RepID=UPI00194174DF|nr:hypothetical protein [Rugosimonospora africana]
MTRAIIAFVIVALFAAVLPGGLAVRDAHGGLVGLLTWTLLVVGLLVVVVGGVLLAVGWWGGRPAELTPDGVRLPGRRTVIPWSAVERCDVRAAGHRRLYAAWLTPPEAGGPGDMLWLGDVRQASVPEEDLLAMVRSWTERP